MTILAERDRFGYVRSSNIWQGVLLAGYMRGSVWYALDPQTQQRGEEGLSLCLARGWWR